MVLLVAGFWIALCLGVALTIPDWGAEYTRFAWPLAGCVVGYLVASVWAFRRSACSSRDLWVVWGAAVLWRALLVGAPPTLSDDLFRYIWDGRVLLAGLHPYAFAPLAPELSHLRDALWSRINHPELPTIYPPLLILVFAASAWISPTVTGWKLTAALFDLAAGYQLMRTFQARGEPAVRVLAYLWHPLLLVEFAGNGHADAVGLFLVATAFRAWTERRPLRAGVALALAGLVKFLPWAALPRLLPELRWRWVVLPVVVAAFYLPFWLGDASPLGSLGAYARTWRSNDLVFGWILQDSPTEASLLAAKRVAALVVLAVLVGSLALRRSLVSVYGWTVGAALLVSPVVHPWYVTWLLPAALLARQPAWWVWSLTVFLAYHPLPGVAAGNGWTESVALKLLQVLPVLALVAVQPWLERKQGLRVSP